MNTLSEYIMEYEEENEIINELVENYEDDIYHANNMDVEYYPYWEHEGYSVITDKKHEGATCNEIQL